MYAVLLHNKSILFISHGTSESRRNEHFTGIANTILIVTQVEIRQYPILKIKILRSNCMNCQLMRTEYRRHQLPTTVASCRRMWAFLRPLHPVHFVGIIVPVGCYFILVKAVVGQHFKYGT